MSSFDSDVGDLQIYARAAGEDAGTWPLSPSRPAVVYIDPRPLTRDSIGGCLSRSLKDFRIHAVADAVQAAATADRDDGIVLVLVNVGSRGIGCPEIAACLSALTADLPHLPVAVLADSDEYGEILAALRAGLRGYIPTSLAPAVVFEAVRLICAGGTYAPSTCLLRHADQQQAAAAASPPSEAPSVSFSPRQRQIVDCLRRGMANKQIAFVLSMSEGTVKVHVRKIMRKLHATNRTQVAMMTLSLPLEGFRNGPSGLLPAK